MLALAAALAAASTLSMTAGRAAPNTLVKILSARTADNGDGYIDHISVTFSATMDTAATPRESGGPGEPGFRVVGYRISSFVWTNSTTLSIGLAFGAVPDTAAMPAVSYVSGGGGAQKVATIPGETNLELSDYSSTPATDGAGPVLLSATAFDRGTAGIFATVGERLVLNFSEPATLTGVGALGRWTNLERALQFNNLGSGCADGDGTPGKFNFPQPTSGNDPVSPVGSSYLAEWTVTANTGNAMPPTAYRFPAVPLGCTLGIAGTGTSLITDAASNGAAGQDLPAARAQARYVHPGDAQLLSARTVDGSGGSANGIADAIELTFDGKIDDGTIAGQLARIGVTVGGQDVIVDTETVDTGAAANDAAFLVRIAPAAETAWDGAVTPQVSYARPSSCANEGTGTVGSGLKALVPTGGAYRACIASFQATVTDGVAPRYVGATTVDSDGNGLINRLRVRFTEPIAVASIAGWTLDGRAANGFSIEAPADVLAIDFLEGETADTGTLPYLRYATQGSGATTDAAGNQVPVTAAFATDDGAAPRISSAIADDSDGDARIDTVVLHYSEDIGAVPDGIAASFAVAGETASSAAATAADTLTLAVGPIEGTDAKAIEYTAAKSIADAAGNATTAQSLPAGLVTDAASPVAVIEVSPTAPLGARTSTVTATFSEDMDSATEPVAALGIAAVTSVADANHTNGWRNDNPRVWDGSVTVSESDCTQSRGCAVEVHASAARDLRGNSMTTASLPTEIDTIAPVAPVLNSFLASVPAGESVPALTLNMFTRAFSLTAAVDAGDAEFGRAEVLLDGAPMSPVALSEVVVPSATSVTATAAFADADALAAAIPEGAHELTMRLCDDAGNCSVSASGTTVAADYTPVAVDLVAPGGGDVVGGGDTLAVEWSAPSDADFDHVDLQYSTDDGATYAGSVLSGIPDAAGARQWTVPEIDANRARVRAVAVDAAGNKAYDASATAFTIDSSPPVVTITAPAADPFVPAGGVYAITWNVSDASVDRVAEPMTIEYSPDGKSWSAINAGDYSRADDGQEQWSVPSGTSLRSYVRVTAADAVGRSARTVSSRLIRGVSGYVADAGGRLVPFGSANDNVGTPAIGKDSVRGIALRKDGRAGYVLVSKGGVYPFAVGDEPVPTKPQATGLGADRARGIALRTTTTGYVVDMYGRVFPFGGAPSVRTSKTWAGKDYARDIVMLPNLRGGYVLDAYGRLHPFAVGNYAMPKAISAPKMSSRVRAVAVVLRSNGQSGWVLSNYGSMYPFGGAATRSNSWSSSTADAKALLMVEDGSGYWVDGRGRLHSWGYAFGDPTRVVLSAGRARDAAG